MSAERPRLVKPVRNGPVLVSGPVRIETPAGVVESDRFMVAICTCGASRIYPLCDTSHRRRERRAAAEPISAQPDYPA
ncbi:CDGSH iron-sulfur domain-containing protein [[Mycobacterium] vasticus]|uniref:CDGSH iron-sulfur domain-containing protein n=1 Tax=[Mycobacterium] vasticus TaxID=2875777 RepID=A0ABU5Z183_9MYCO|nr:CDGSH iron-sulfur domain-containing protein [Mycolicibacter sp. MYC017]MEB3069979.1 CDGSH iron-sulfur domain-containing protein [Mycolicibacter sp. MYC017]